ncbi:MAG: orotidine 5'-phosphate decarboxylase / HUMPS family protein [Planctomycetota bacterium]|jgi:3-hexulose-6-phosphate synthase/6-phospho-3-hexuloisomerase
MATTTTTAQLQVALDMLELSRAKKVAREAVAGGVHILEAGTPLIKSEGLDAVRWLRGEFPNHTIVADMKVMDAGRLEVEAAAKAGANIVAVMAAASESTIKECVEAGRNYGAEIAVDFLGVTDLVAMGRKVAEWGAAIINLHVPIDDQMRGDDPLERVRTLRGAVDIKIAAAGGLHSEVAGEVVKAGADIVIVGGAINKSADAKAATEAVLKAMATGEAVKTDLYKRAGDLEGIRKILLEVSTPNLSDALHRQPCLPGIRPVVEGAKMAGPAVTVRTYPGDWAKTVQAIEHANPGDVLCFDAGGVPPAVWGELATESAVQKQLAGVVCFGAVRDVKEIRELGFPTFATHITSEAGEPKGFGEINAPVRIAGQRVAPGDWLVGDDNGVLVVPKERVVEYANRAMSVLETENRLRGEIRQASSLAEVAELLRWEKK